MRVVPMATMETVALSAPEIRFLGPAAASRTGTSGFSATKGPGKCLDHLDRH
jgi:hypothetical protein